MLVKDFIKRYPNDSFDMMTPGGFVFLTPEQAKDLLAGKSVMGHPGDPEYAMRIDAEELLSDPVCSARWKNHVCHMMTGMPSEVISSKTAKEVEKMLSEHEKEQHLKERVKSSYEAYIQQLKAKPAPDLIEMASEIAATKFVYEELMVDGYFSDCIDYLLQFDDPLEQAVSCWQEDQDFDHHEDLEHALWSSKELDISRGIFTPSEQTGQGTPTLSQGVTMC